MSDGRDSFGSTALTEAKGRSGLRRVIKIGCIAIAILSALAVISGTIYWHHLKDTPQYSLALIVDAARRNDQAQLNELIDTSAVVDDFLPQVLDNAVDLYARGIDPAKVRKLSALAAPLMPGVKDKIREKLPELIRQKTSEAEGVPFPLIVLGADRYLEITSGGSSAVVRSKLEDQDTEIVMEKKGPRWVVTAIKDDKLARSIASTVGQEVVAIAVKGGSAETSLGDLKKINELLDQVEKLFQ